jgi:GDPmannose 4,6-dehydratase
VQGLGEDMQMKAVITGIRGQDGHFLARLLLEQGYQVIGTSHSWQGQLAIGDDSVNVYKLDLTSQAQINELVREHRPDHIYALAARASSADLNADPEAMTQINGVSVLRILEAIRLFSPATKFCFASSSEVFAGATITPQDELTAVAPLNIYAAAKAYGMHVVRIYRQIHQLFACSAILYTHESHLRPEHFLVQKVCTAAARISLGLQEKLLLGSLSAQRDWAYAGDTVRAMLLILQADTPDDFIISTGHLHSVRDVCEVAFRHVGLDYRGYVVESSDVDTGRRVERVALLGNSLKAKKILDWAPSIDFETMISSMVDYAKERHQIHSLHSLHSLENP